MGPSLELQLQLAAAMKEKEFGYAAGVAADDAAEAGHAAAGVRQAADVVCDKLQSYKRALIADAAVAKRMRLSAARVSAPAVSPLLGIPGELLDS